MEGTSVSTSKRFVHLYLTEWAGRVIQKLIKQQQQQRKKNSIEEPKLGLSKIISLTYNFQTREYHLIVQVEEWNDSTI